MRQSCRECPVTRTVLVRGEKAGLRGLGCEEFLQRN